MSLLQVSHLNVQYPKQETKALDNVSFTLKKGEALGVVGESGCGKSTLVKAVLQLLPKQSQQSGEIIWHGKNLAEIMSKDSKSLYRQAQLIFQDPLDALNPRLTIAQIIAEPLENLAENRLSRTEIRKAVGQMLDRVGLSHQVLNRYPHEFSGGQCQRIGIARAMIIQPELLICDEPVSALDVSVQAQVMNVLLELKQTTDLSLIFISHDLSVVRHISDRVLVMNQGRVVEAGETEQIYQQPQQAYTQALLDAIPRLNNARL